MSEIKPVTLILVRHGRTTLNQAGRFRGRLPVPLDDVGVQQAERLANRLGELCGPGGLYPQPGAVYSSPLPRTLQTATPLASTLGVSLKKLDDLDDMDYGSWEGLTHDEAKARDPEIFARWSQDPENTAVPGGESLGTVQHRAVAAIQQVVQQGVQGTGRERCWVLVSHDVLWQSYFCWVFGLPLTRRDEFRQDPAAFDVVQVPTNASGQVTLITSNETSHLMGLLDPL